MPDKETTIALVQEHYGKIARGEQCGCGAPTAEFAKIIGYAEKDVTSSKGNLGLGCGNPLALAEIEPGMTVLDLGSGAGFDAFIAWRHVGPTGRVIGVDMTDDMLAQARKNAADLGAGNVEFRQGYIEALPVEDASVDLVISNCVINLSADKPAVFREIFRVLKPGGRFAVSDLVLLGKLPAEVEADVRAYVGCIAGASPIADYIRFALDAGLNALSIPEIATGRALMESMTPGSSCCSDPVVDAAAAAIASVKLHGSKSAN
jgi:SAM-dependent methyltransferase